MTKIGYFKSNKQFESNYTFCDNFLFRLKYQDKLFQFLNLGVI